MGWTDNGKIMPPWITLSEQRETESGGGGGGGERDAGTEERNFVLKCSVRD